eukprot:7918357-Lingulodinium_polyedra.AAC.1
MPDKGRDLPPQMVVRGEVVGAGTVGGGDGQGLGLRERLRIAFEGPRRVECKRSDLVVELWVLVNHRAGDVGPYIQGMSGG